VCFPAAVLFEVAGTWPDGEGHLRPLRKACSSPGTAKPDWQIICELARAMGATGFEYESAAAITRDAGLVDVRLRIRRAAAPLAATDPRYRCTHFRGHRLDEKVGGLRDLPLAEPAARTAVGG
jgi:NADH dehydrogenase/NADH:ubiquinone oxidoreductase subunit G